MDIKNKVIRYNKKVYINSLINELKKRKRKGKKRRLSKYRGVSRNGNGWQAIMMSNKNKPYLGTFNSEELAARIYDIESIKQNGRYAKTNFSYSKEQIKKIIELDINYKNLNISNILK